MRSAIISSLLLAPLIALTGCPDDVDDDTSSTPDEVIIPTFENAIVVADQPLAGLDMLTIERIALDAPGYLVVRQALAERPTLPGEAIAVVAVPSSTMDLEVTLDRPTRAGEQLFATLHVESNGNDVFDFDQMPGVDPPALDDMGLPASAAFSIALPASAIIAVDQSVQDNVWVDAVQIASVIAPTPHTLLALHTSLDDLTRPVGFVALPDLVSEDVLVTITEPVTHDTTLFAVLHEDLGTRGSFDEELDLPVTGGDGQPINARFIVTLDPAPDASLSCTPTRASCVAPSVTLPLRMRFEADHDGYLLVRYIDTRDEPRAAAFPISAQDTSASGLILPSAACDTTFEVSMLVAVEGVDPLTAPILPYATDADGATVICSVDITREQPAELVAGLTVDPADMLSLTSTIAGFEALANDAAFITVSSVDTLIEPSEQVEDAELLGFARQTSRGQDLDIELVRPLIQGEIVLVAAYSDVGTVGVFDPADTLLLAFGKNGEFDEQGEDMQPPPMFLQSALVIDEVGTSEPFLTLTDEVSFGASSVRVRQSVASEDALIVVFDDGGGRPGQPLGFAPVGAGVNQDVQVTLARATRSEERLYVLLLSDGNLNQSYDDIFTDPVFVRDAAPVMQTILVEAGQ